MIGLWTRALFTTCLLTMMLACGDEEPTPPPAGNATIELVGDWHSAYGGVDKITKDKWGTATIITVDNTKNEAIVQSPADDPFTANQFAKYLWTEPKNGRFAYCTVDYGLATKEAALASTKTANPADLTMGCDNFPWTSYEPPFELTGAYLNNFQGTETIDSDTWLTMGTGFESEVDIKHYDNDANVAVTQNPNTDAFNPSKFNKVVWTEPAAGTLHYCIVAFGLETLEGARTSTQTADRTSPDTSGCGGAFAWTKLAKR